MGAEAAHKDLTVQCVIKVTCLIHQNDWLYTLYDQALIMSNRHFLAFSKVGVEWWINYLEKKCVEYCFQRFSQNKGQNSLLNVLE